jgi:hypothetical protein
MLSKEQFLLLGSLRVPTCPMLKYYLTHMHCQINTHLHVNFSHNIKRRIILYKRKKKKKKKNVIRVCVYCSQVKIHQHITYAVWNSMSCSLVFITSHNIFYQTNTKLLGGRDVLYHHFGMDGQHTYIYLTKSSELHDSLWASCK